MSVRVSAAGARLNVELRGPEGAPPLVLLHAFPLSHRMWEPQLEALSASYRIVAPDCRGFGASEPGDGQYTIELFVDDLLAVLDHLGLGGVVACGLSMGGYVLQRAVARAPERFHAVVLADTRSEADDDAGRLARAETIRKVKAEGVDAFAPPFARRLLGATTCDARPDLVAHVEAMIREASPLAIGGALLAIAARTDSTDTLRSLDVPALIVVGDEDGITPIACAERMAAAAPRSRLAVIPGAGHLPNLERPEAFDRALLSFLDEVAG